MYTESEASVGYPSVKKKKKTKKNWKYSLDYEFLWGRKKNILLLVFKLIFR